jgi:hypothetical protein
MKAEAAKDLKIDIVTPNPVQLHWLITDTDVRQTYATVVPNGNSWSVYSLRIRFNVSEADRDKLVSSSLNLSVRIGHHLVTKGFELALNFPLNKVNNRRLPLPFEPYFIQFEDPEYNRLLASNTAHATRIVKDQVTTDAGLQQVGHSVTLSTDRREYNADSEVTLRYDWDDDRTYTGTIQIGYLGIVPSENPPLILPSTTMLSSGTLARYNLAELVQAYNKFQESANRIKLSPGDRVQVKVTVHGTGMSTPVPIVLELPIIQKPITPSPQAGFGLLRSNQLDEQRWVECARFAWTPEATRVEMVCAEDLRTEIVRRRAVFQWRDSARPNRSTLYAIQKITLMGSTHFPWVE